MVIVVHVVMVIGMVGYIGRRGHRVFSWLVWSKFLALPAIIAWPTLVIARRDRVLMTRVVAWRKP